MYTHGKIKQQWPNGVITYKGRPTRADGAGGMDLLNYTMRRAREDLEELRNNPRASVQEIERAEQAYARAVSHANEVALMEEEVDDLDSDDDDEPGFADGGDDDFDNMDFDELHDDFDDAEYLKDDEMDQDDDFDDDAQEDEPAFPDSRKRKRDPSIESSNGGSSKLPRRAAKKPKGQSPRVPEDLGAAAAVPLASLESGTVPVGDEQPPSFSRIDPDTLRNPEELAAKFPEFSKAVPVTFELSAGEMLWLPAGWFHEVVSFSDGSNSQQGHAAFNYWMHPPTNDNFDHPYPDGYWKEKFATLNKWVNEKLNPLPAGVTSSSPPKAAAHRPRAPPRLFDDFFEPSDEEDTPARRRAALRRNPRVLHVSKSFKPPSGVLAAAEGEQLKMERKLPPRSTYSNSSKKRK
jgi:hypothetical protein